LKHYRLKTLQEDNQYKNKNQTSLAELRLSNFSRKTEEINKNQTSQTKIIIYLQINRIFTKAQFQSSKKETLN
jgi:hypothetical protein